MKTEQGNKVKIRSFTDLLAWQVGHQLVLEIYRVTDKFPAKEQFGLTSQMRRASVSITSNIAEGFSRRTKQDKAHFYVMATGSLTELQNQLMVAKDVGFTSEESFAGLADTTVYLHKLLSGLMKSAETKREPGK